MSCLRPVPTSSGSFTLSDSMGGLRAAEETSFRSGRANGGFVWRGIEIQSDRLRKTGGKSSDGSSDDSDRNVSVLTSRITDKDDIVERPWFLAA
jgi:hypothetical protein